MTDTFATIKCNPMPEQLIKYNFPKVSYLTIWKLLWKSSSILINNLKIWLQEQDEEESLQVKFALVFAFS